MNNLFNEQSQHLIGINNRPYTLLPSIDTFNNKVNYNFSNDNKFHKRNPDEVTKIRDTFYSEISHSKNSDLSNDYKTFLRFCVSMVGRNWNKGYFFKPHSVMAQRLKLSQRTLSRIKNKFVTLGVLIVIKKGGKGVCAYYSIDFERLSELCSSSSFMDMSAPITHFKRSQLLGEISKKLCSSAATVANYIYSCFKYIKPLSENAYVVVDEKAFLSLTRNRRLLNLKSHFVFLSQLWTEFLGVNVTPREVISLRKQHVNKFSGVISHTLMVPPTFFSGEVLGEVYHAAA